MRDEVLPCPAVNCLFCTTGAFGNIVSQLSGDMEKKKGEEQNMEQENKNTEQENKNTEQEMHQMEKQQYQEQVNKITPKHNLFVQMAKAFLVGGVICCIGQFILNYAANRAGLDKETAGAWCSMLLVLLSVVLTGFNIYPKLVEWGGAGALVPITGFANSVSAPAIEYQKEGQVFGIGCKIFTIAGPVILYGIFTSWALGLLYWIGKVAGVF